MKKLLLLICIIMTVTITGCSSTKTNQAPADVGATITKISPQEAKTRLDNEADIIIVDVRTLEEYNEEHIKNAVLLSLDTISENAASVIPDKDAIYFIYCRSGNRSATAAAQLVEMGYKNIYDLGGIKDWPYEKESSQ